MFEIFISPSKSSRIEHNWNIVFLGRITGSNSILFFNLIFEIDILWLSVAAAVKNILSDFHLVSSRQLALILSKKNDDCLRVARCENRGFTWYKDKDGNVYYNLPEVMREIGIGVNA